MVQGRIRGVEHEGFDSYIGIPYATVNGYGGRFKKGNIAPTWLGIRESHDPYCTFRSEATDCLQLDVYVPKAAGAPWPVLVWVKSSSGDYHPDKLVKQGIIVVIARHRIGPIGFLCSQEDHIPGNVGVKDIVSALRWVRDNIVAFKGNPHRVVVAGQGFGAAIVEALTITPMADGLFHGAIIQSGSILAPWAFNYDATDKTQYLQLMLNDTELLRAPTMDIVEQSEELDVPYFPFGLCIEKAIKNEESLFSEAPYNTLMKGKMSSVPLIIGYNTDEAYIFISTLQDVKSIKKMARDTSYLLPAEFQAMSEREMRPIIKQVTDMYFNNDITTSSVLGYYRDAYFLNHIYRSVKFHASHSPVYFYQFSHSGNVGVLPEADVQKSGAAHSDELAYLFPSDIDFDGDDVAVHQHMIQLWTSFVKDLKPSGPVEWDTMASQYPRLLDISTSPTMMDFPHRREMAMWEGIYEKYYFRRH
ncbi:esterase FE4-like [Colias croceus]|uniref:esterase FE4-like n=1 Tax=Colias crocea TaxID=72248 RepID=UPI001E27E352|nr:esterase FE4-like [Colias croceus]